MTEDRRNIFLWNVRQVGKYSPVFNPKECDYSKAEEIYIIQHYDKPGFKWEDYNFRFYWKLKSELEEKKLRTYDCFYDGRGMMMYRGFFVHDWLLNCWSDLIDKDIKIISTECRTLNGIVKDFHLVYVMNIVEGIDEKASVFSKKEMDRLVPKASNEFMEGHQIACEKRRNIYIYITPELKERTLKAKGKSKLKDVSRMYGPY